jgi:hypothetical protein
MKDITSKFHQVTQAIHRQPEESYFALYTKDIVHSD